MNHSESVAKVSAAFVKAQGELRNPAATAKANYGTYAPLERIVDDARKVLTSHGLAFQQEATTHEGHIGITTVILHESGEWLSFGPLVVPPGQQNAQQYGSAITYARRYSLCAVLGVNADEDDDGHKASRTSGARTAATPEPRGPESMPETPSANVGSTGQETAGTVPGGVAADEGTETGSRTTEGVAGPVSYPLAKLLEVAGSKAKAAKALTLTNEGASFSTATLGSATEEQIGNALTYFEEQP